MEFQHYCKLDNITINNITIELCNKMQLRTFFPCPYYDIGLKDCSNKVFEMKCLIEANIT